MNIKMYFNVIDIRSQFIIKFLWNLIGSVGIAFLLSIIMTIFIKHLRFQSILATHIVRNQLIIDVLVLVFALMTINLTRASTVCNIAAVDAFVCYIWTSQWVYWASVVASIINTLLTSIDRLMAVKWPYSYKSRISLKIKLYYLSLMGLTVIIIGPEMLNNVYINNTCVDRVNVPGDKSTVFFAIYGFYYFITAYFLPVIISISSYIIILKMMTRSASIGNQGSSSMKASARKFTFSTFAMMVVFMVAYGIENIAYMLKFLNVIHYDFFSPLQMVGVSVVTLPSIINPLIFIILVKPLTVKWLGMWCRIKIDLENSVKDVN